VLPKVKEEEPFPHPAELDLQYLGRFGPPDKQIAVFAKGTVIINKQEGKVIGDGAVRSFVDYLYELAVIG
jgi:hypothetical protein